MIDGLPEVRPDAFLDALKVDIREALDTAAHDICVVAGVRHVETGEETQVVNCERFPHEQLSRMPADERRKAMIHIVTQQVKALLLHELDECLYVDGVRLCENPHPEKQKRAV